MIQPRWLPLLQVRWQGIVAAALASLTARAIRYPPATEGYVTPSHGTNLSAGHIVPFAPLAAQNASNVSWNYAMLQSVGGGFLVGDFSDDESDDNCFVLYKQQ